MPNVLQIVVAEATTNKITNPSVEEGTTDWAAVGAGVSISRVSTQQAKGVYSVEVTPNNAIGDGVAVGSYTLSVATEYTWSAWVKGEAGVGYKIQAYDADAAAELDSTTFAATGSWERQTVTATTDGTNTNYQLRVVTTEADTNVFYVDAVQIEEKGYATTYCDGDQEGCEWAGAEHASESSRDARSRDGGRVYNVGTADLTESQLFGAGMPPVSVLTQGQALLPGRLYQRTKVRERMITVVLVVNALATSTYMSERQALIARLKPDDVN